MKKPEPDTALSDLENAFRLLEKNQVEKARNLLVLLKKLPVESLPFHTGMGNLSLRLGEYALAIEHLTQALAIDPESIPILRDLASAYQATHQFAPAEVLLLRVTAQQPDHPEALNALTTIYILTSQLDKARETAEQVLASNPRNADAHRNLSHILSNTNEPELALEHATLATRLSPKAIQNYFNTSGILIHLGKNAEATREIEKALRIDPLSGAAYELLSTIKKWTPNDLVFIEQTEKKLQKDMDIQNRANFHFALGKMYDDIGMYDKAFFHFQKGNLYGKPAIRKKLNHELVAKQKALCTRKYLSSMPQEDTSAIPVFIVGMPRSGTTLVEQIIASHPQAAGAGELTELGAIGNELYGTQKYGDGLLQINKPDASTRHAYAERYLAELRKNRETALRITDKMPENFNLLGTIAMLFPRARVIHTIRNPLDTCLSCYFQMFTHVSWSYDIEWIVETYHYYRKTMAYWKKTLPEGMLMDVVYENLTANPEQESRRIINHIGLDWDPGCLEFFNTRREVRTSSAWQVRQPIYQGSTQRWVNYAPHIDELANALSAYLQEDKALLQEHGITLKKPGLLSFMQS